MSVIRLIILTIVFLYSSNLLSNGTNIFGLGIYDIKFDGSDTHQAQILDMNIGVMNHCLLLDQKKIIFFLKYFLWY